MIRRRIRTEEDVSFQLAPMIDMTFLLLIFFMVTSKLSKEQIKMDIRLPVASAAVLPDDLGNRDLLNIDAEGRYFIGENELTEGELRAYLAERFRANPPLRLYVRGDKDMPYKTTKKVMEMATEAGAIDVIFGTLRE